MPEDIRNARRLFREETPPMSLDGTEDYIEDVVPECSVHCIPRNVHRDPENPERLTAVVEHTRVSAVVDFEEIVPGETRVRFYAPRQLCRNSGIRSLDKLLEEPCPAAQR